MDLWTIAYHVAGFLFGVLVGHVSGYARGFVQGGDDTAEVLTAKYNRESERASERNKMNAQTITKLFYCEAAKRSFGAYEVNKATGSVEWKWKESGAA